MAKEIRLPVRGGPRRSIATLLMIALTATLSACGVSPKKVTVPVVDKVDLQRFMGPWYVIGVMLSAVWLVLNLALPAGHF